MDRNKVGIVFLLSIFMVCCDSKKPNIVFILADDLGWADVSWNDPKILSPNLEQLKNESLVLDNYYVYQSCTPSRGAILTGHYAHSIGLQHGVFQPTRPSYLPLDVKTFPERLKELGYRTAAVGKWHLGYCDWAVTPTSRGFDQFNGIYLGGGDHYTNERKFKGITGYDYRDNTAVDNRQRGVYSTIYQTQKAVDIIREHNDTDPLYLYLSYQSVHKPLQVPPEYERMNRGRGMTGKRLTLAAMVTIMDEGIGNVTRALKEKGIYDDTIVIFSSDNGGPVQDGGFNYPYRGGKATFYEGGTKVVGFIRSNQLRRGNFKGLFHAIDWYPTLVGAAGSSESESSVNGIDQWENLLQNTTGRQEFVYNLNEVRGNAAIRVGRYKLIIGTQGKLDGWYRSVSEVKTITKTSKLSQVKKSPGFPQLAENNHLLFDLETDPYERVDLSGTRPGVVRRLYRRLSSYRDSMRPAFYPDVMTNAANPANYGGVWTPGWCTARRPNATDS